MSLPDEYVKSGLILSKGMTIFGQPVERLEREELIAAVAKAYEREQRFFRQREHESHMLKLFSK